AALPIYSSKTDVFSLGLSFIELCAWKPIDELKLIFDNCRAGKQNAHIRDTETTEFVNMLTEVDPSKRPTCDELLAHPYLS
ncbi:hypothetical protein PMAYCL1PPCAC_09318, partial [Pristionchus mayeri]